METILNMQHQTQTQNQINIFLHKKIKLPPNQLITKQYSPQTKPNIKYITIDELNKKQTNINYIPPKVKNQMFQQYGSKFHIMDFLGYHYANQFDQMIYFKYNNNQYNQYKDPLTDKKYKYFAGLFIPLTELTSKNFKYQQNIFNPLKISIPEIKQSVIHSFAKNCKGCSLDPLFSSNFYGGNLMAVIRKKPYQYDLIIQNDINSKAAQLFNFAVKFIQEGIYKFNIVNLSASIPLYQMGMKIPYYSYLQQSFKSQSQQSLKTGEGWKFGGQNITFVKSQLRKQNQTIQNTYYCLSFEYKCKSRQEITIFSNSFPYSSLDYEKFLNQAVMNKIGHHMKMEKLQICQTLAGQKIFAYMFYHRKSKSKTILLRNFQTDKIKSSRSSEKSKTVNLGSLTGSLNLGNYSPVNISNKSNDNINQNPNKTIVLMARQNPGQTVSSYLIEGVIQFLMDNTQYDSFKKNIHFLIIPFVNLDGMKYGNQRTNLAGANLNKVWRNPDQIFQPQVFHLKKFLKTINKSDPIIMMLNLESNNYSLSSHFKSLHSKRQQNSQLFPYVCSKRINQISFQDSEFFAEQTNKSSSLNVLTQIFPKALVYNFNTSIYGWKVQAGVRKYTDTHQNQNSIYQFSPEIYRYMGRQIISTYLQLIRLCDKNIGIKDRWQSQIRSLPQNLKCKQNYEFKNKNLMQYEQTWANQRIKFNYIQFHQKIQNSPTKIIRQVKKNNTAIFKDGNMINSNIQNIRRMSKKRTMPQLKKLQEKQNNTIQISQSDIKKSAYEQLLSPSNIRKSNGLDNFKKNTLSSGLLNPIGRSNFLQQISKQIKMQAQKQQQSILSTSNSVQLTLKNEKQKRGSKFLTKYRENMQNNKINTNENKKVKLEGINKLLKNNTIIQEDQNKNKYGA